MNHRRPTPDASDPFAWARADASADMIRRAGRLPVWPRMGSMLLMGCGAGGFDPRQLPSLAAWYPDNLRFPQGMTTGGAASFASASSQSLQIGANLITANSQAWGISLWANLADFAAVYDLVHISNIEIDITTGKNAQCACGGGANTGSVTLTAGVPAHIVVAYDGTNLNLYVNGSLDHSIVSVSSSGSAATFLGSTGVSRFLNGSLDAVLFFNGYTPTSSDVTALYNGGNGVAAKDLTGNLKVKCTAGYDFDGPGANLVKDYIGSNTLTNINAVTYAAGQVSSTTLADGDAVSKWSDQSGNGNHLVQATAANRPIYKVSVQNGRPVVRFTTANNTLMAATFTLNQPCTMILVGKNTVAAGSSSRMMAGGATNTTILKATDWTTEAGASVDSGIASDNNWHSFINVINGASTFMQVDGTVGTVGSAGASNPGGITIGGLAGGGNYMTGDIGEVIAYSAAKGASQNAQLYNYIKQAWNTP